MTIKHEISLEVKDDKEAAQVRRILDGYQFVGSGLLSLNDKLEKKDWLITSATKSFIKKK